MKISIIIPVYNEECTVSRIIDAALSAPLPSGMSREIVIVNDGSSDGTGEILQKYASVPNIKIFHLPFNQGKASALQRGFDEATGEVVLIQDADLEYDPQQYPKLLEPFFRDDVHVVYGSRFKGVIHWMAPVNRLANYLATGTFNFIYGTRLSDINTGFKIMRRTCLKNIRIQSEHFVGDIEITAKLVRAGFPIVEIPIEYSARSVADGKKMDWGKAWVLYCGIFYFRWASQGS